MATYVEAPTIDVAQVLGDAATATPELTDNLLLSAADSCGLLGTAQGLVDDAAAEVAAAADAAINKTVESAGKLTKKVKDYASETASDAGAYLSETFDTVNSKIQVLFADATETSPGSGEFESIDLDQFLADIQPYIDSITSTFASVKTAVEDAIAGVNDFLTGFTSKVLEIANDLRTMACNGANQALTAVGSGVSDAFDSLAGPLLEGKSSQDVIKEKHSSGVQSQAEVAKANADSVNAQADSLLANLDANVAGDLDNLNNLAVL